MTIVIAPINIGYKCPVTPCTPSEGSTVYLTVRSRQSSARGVVRLNFRKRFLVHQNLVQIPHGDCPLATSVVRKVKALIDYT